MPTREDRALLAAPVPYPGGRGAYPLGGKIRRWAQRRGRPLMALTAALATPMVTASAVTTFPSSSRLQEKANPEQLRLGREVYDEQCRPCHGTKGKGDGPAARFLDPPPHDFTTGRWNYAKGGRRKKVVEIVRQGIEGTGMDPFEETLERDQIEAVAAYVVEVLAKADDSGRPLPGPKGPPMLPHEGLDRRR
ncbi:MAG: c-type cytochrome [Acidobacteriota bacterium]